MGYYNSVAYQAVSTTLPQGCSICTLVSVLYFPLPRKSIHIPKHGAKVEVWRLVAYHDSPVGGPTR